MSNLTNDRFHELMSVYLDDQLDPQQETDLLTYLDEPEFRERFLQFVHTDRAIAGLTASLVSDDTLAALVGEDIAKTLAEQPEQAPAVTTVPAPVSGSSSSGLPRVLLRRGLWPAIAAMSAAVAILVAVLNLRQPDRDKPPTGAGGIANLEDAVGDVRVVTAEGQTLSIEQSGAIESGDTIRTRGAQSAVIVVYADGTRLTLVGDTDVTCADTGHKSVVVHQGTLAAAVKPQPKGSPMLLATPAAQVQVVGTQFVVEALRNQTDLSVTEGSVRLIRVSDGKTVDVPSGKRLLAANRSELAIEDIPQPPDTWDLDFEDGLPANFGGGLFVQDAPPGSKGSVAAVLTDLGQWGDVYEIKSQARWYSGLFAVHDDSHFHFTYKMKHPKWVNVFIIAPARVPTPHTPATTCSTSCSWPGLANLRHHPPTVGGRRVSPSPSSGGPVQERGRHFLPMRSRSSSSSAQTRTADWSSIGCGSRAVGRV